MVFSNVHKKIGMWAGTITLVGSLYAGATVFFGVQIRPAWGWELDATNVRVAETIKQLNSQQQQFQLQFLQYDRRDLRSQLYENLDQQRIYKKSNDDVPQVLIDQEREIKDELEDMSRQIDNLERSLIDLEG